MKKKRVKDNFLEQLRKIPIIQVACEKVNVSRNSVYRWKREDLKFKEEMEIALTEGEAVINDISEHQLLSLIKEKNWPAISFWLKHRNPKFRERLDVTAKIENQEVKLTPEEDVMLDEAIKRLSGINPKP